MGGQTACRLGSPVPVTTVLITRLRQTTLCAACITYLETVGTPLPARIGYHACLTSTKSHAVEAECLRLCAFFDCATASNTGCRSSRHPMSLSRLRTIYPTREKSGSRAGGKSTFSSLCHQTWGVHASPCGCTRPHSIYSKIACILSHIRPAADLRFKPEIKGPCGHVGLRARKAPNNPAEATRRAPSREAVRNGTALSCRFHKHVVSPARVRTGRTWLSARELYKA